MLHHTNSPSVYRLTTKQLSEDALVEEQVGLTAQHGRLVDLRHPTVADVEPLPGGRGVRVPGVRVWGARVPGAGGQRLQQPAHGAVQCVLAVEVVLEPRVVGPHLDVGRVVAAGQPPAVLHHAEQGVQDALMARTHSLGKNMITCELIENKNNTCQ